MWRLGSAADAVEQFKLAIAKSPYSEWADKAQQMLNTLSTSGTP